MKKILLLIGILFFCNTSHAEKYPNSWKMEIECKERGNKWWEASYVVEVVDNKFSVSFDEKWNWMKDIVFEGKIEKNKVTIKQTFKHFEHSGEGRGFYKGKIKDNNAKLKGYRKFKDWDSISCKGNFFKVDKLPMFASLVYLDNASREIIEFTSYDPVGAINIYYHLMAIIFL